MSVEVPAAEPQIEELTSLSDHEATFSPELAHEPMAPTVDDTDDTERNDRGQFRPRHRAQSQKAGPEDVAQIGELTKRLKTAEELAAKDAGITRKDGESDRIWTLRRRAELAERHTQKPQALPEPPKLALVQRPATDATGFTKAEPTLEQFATSDDPYRDYMRALARHDREKEAFEAKQTADRDQSTTAEQEHAKQFDAWVDQHIVAHQGRLAAFEQANPQAKALFAAEASKPANEQIGITQVMRAAMEFHPNGPAGILTLLQDPKLATQLRILTRDQLAFDNRGNMNPLVAEVQRLLELERVPAVVTGSVATPPKVAPPAPRPPNPVRTAPQSPSDTPPGDGASLADHERFYGPKARR